MESLSLFNERLTELLFDKNLNAKQLAAALGIGESAVSGWRSGKKSLSMTNIVLLADFLCCSIDYLIGRSGNDSVFVSKPLPPFPQRIREVMREKGWSRYRMDKETRFKDSYFTNWDKGQLPKLTTLTALAELLDCSVDYLVGRE